MYQESLDNDLESDQRRNNIEEGEIGVSEALEPVENEESTEIDRNNITAQENETGDSGNEETIVIIPNIYRLFVPTKK